MYTYIINLRHDKFLEIIFEGQVEQKREEYDHEGIMSNKLRKSLMYLQYKDLKVLGGV